MIRALALALLLCAAPPAFAAETAPSDPPPAPTAKQAEQAPAWYLISAEQVAQITAVIQRTAEMIEAQQVEIERLRAKLARGGCT